ncbi:MAG: SMI1/KNR4 family protein [Lachnospiraceae bacterium]|nr:SMI1/KNR4 family protein [Lachnospiraceae bacterium]
MAEFQEGTLDTLMERLCSSISGFDPEWVTRCVPATEEQIQQLQDILAEYNYTIPAAYLYYLRRMGQNDGGLSIRWRNLMALKKHGSVTRHISSVIVQVMLLK